MSMALSYSEVNSSMGKIVAYPTTGYCGIIPAAILTTDKKLGKTKDYKFEEENNASFNWNRTFIISISVFYTI